MRIHNWLGPLAALAAGLLATGAHAIVPITDAQERTRQEIGRQLGPQHSYALVIGISEFDNPGWTDLGGVESEYRMITAALEAQDFKVVGESRLGRVDHRTLTETIARFFDTYGKNAEDRLVVYIATHGYSDPARPDADGFLVASDGGAPRNGVVANGYSVKQLSAALTSLAAQHVFLFFNSCFSGSMLPEPTRESSMLLSEKPKLALSQETADWTLDLLAHNARLVLTAGNASQTVPDANNPFSRAVVDALAGEADVDGDGLILGTEIAQFVRGRVARATRLSGHANDPVFAVLPKLVGPAEPRPDLSAPERVEYSLQGDFIFLTPGGPKQTASGESEQEALLRDRQRRLLDSQFVACIDCPTMVEVPGTDARLALSATEITYAQWDACFRESACRRYLPDDGLGRGDRPAGGVTWLDALEYTTWLGTKNSDDAPCLEYRLPSAEEWRSAALYGGHGSVSWEAAVADAAAVCWGCGPGQDGNAALRAASSPANPAGLYDMIGNLWEWVDADAGACDLTALRQNGGCAPGLVMGGSFATSAEALPRIGAGGAAPRTTNERPWSSPSIGFRVACDIGAAG
jgi:formylglycine-generating enzyme required for sulfatase activity